jgi:hypothetical protein
LKCRIYIFAKMSTVFTNSIGDLVTSNSSSLELTSASVSPHLTFACTKTTDELDDVLARLQRDVADTQVTLRLLPRMRPTPPQQAPPEEVVDEASGSLVPDENIPELELGERALPLEGPIEALEEKTASARLVFRPNGLRTRMSRSSDFVETGAGDGEVGWSDIVIKSGRKEGLAASRMWRCWM